MRLVSLPWLELSRFRRSLATRLALVIVLVVPCLYGGLYLASNWNPTGNLHRLQAAVVDQDTPAVTTGPGGTDTTVSAGREITEQLTGSSAVGFTWHRVSADRAREGLRDGEYSAVMTIPEGFSAALVSTTGPDPRRAELSVVTDDADNYIIGSIATSLTTTLRDRLAATTTAKYLDGVYVGFNTIHASMTKAAGGAQELAGGARGAADGAHQLTVGLHELSDGAAGVSNGTSRLASGSRDLSRGTGTLASGAQDAANGAHALATGLVKLQRSTADLPQQTQQLAAGAASVSAGAHQVADAAAAVASSADAVGAASSAVEDAPTQLRATSSQVQSAAADLQQVRSDVDDQLLSAARAVAAAHPDDQRAQQLVGDLQRLGAQLARSADQVSPSLDRAATVLDGSAAQLQGAATSADQARSALQHLAGGAAQVADGASSVSTGASRLADAAGPLTAGISSASEASSALAAGTSRLAEGARSAATGAAQLSSGATALQAGSQRLTSGLEEAGSGATRLAGGTEQLADGSTELAQGLRSGADAVPTYSDDDRAQRSEVVAAPVQSTVTRAHAVSAYGEGLAPYFLPLALWIGAMLSYMVLRAVSPRALAATASSWRAAWSGYLPGAALAVLQAVALMGTVHLLLGFHAASAWGTTAFAVLVALVFAAIHQCLNALMRATGRLLAMVLLLLQLASAGGTYPVATADAFFRAISPWMPMTHAVDGLRHLVAQGWTGQVWGDVLALTAAGLVAIGITLYACRVRRTWTVSTLHPSLAS